LEPAPAELGKLFNGGRGADVLYWLHRAVTRFAGLLWWPP
jgi:hypothetical protein